MNVPNLLLIRCLVGSRSGDRLDAFSAPTSPMAPPQTQGGGRQGIAGQPESHGGGGMEDEGESEQQTEKGTNGQAQQQTTILRNPLRGSKCK